MVDRKCISDLRNGDPVEDEVFLVVRKELRKSRKGSDYIDGEVMDKSGTLPIRMWDATEKISSSFDVQGFVRVSGRVESYRDTLQLVVKKIAKADEDSVSMADFVPTTEQDVDKMEESLRKMLRTVKDRHLIDLLAGFFNDEAFMACFRACPAAVQFHHAYLGGLLEHTLSMTKLACWITDHYPRLDKDLLLAGVFLHDIGKVRELNWERGFQYTNEGQLVGHLVLGASMVEEKARGVEGFPQELLDRLKHLILSHHGEYEFGSPKLPATAEAIALHYIDNLDAKMHAFEKAINEDRDPSTDWTEYNRMFARRLYKK